MIDQRTSRRTYIERLRNDPRTRQLMDSWVVQTMMEVEAKRGRPADEREAIRFAQEVAEQAVTRAMSFVLDHDGEYKMVREELDRVLERSVELVNTMPPRTLVMPGSAG